jgi:dipeptidyl aminopeptidase/acylaminoacyl peptidase
MGEKQGRNGIYAATVGTTDETIVVSTVSGASYSQGYLFFERDSALLAQPFDTEQMRLTGSPVTVGGSLATNRSYFFGAFSVSASTLAYRGGQLTEPADLMWFDRSGKQLGTAGERAAWLSLNLSGDDSQLAVVRADPSNGNSDIWTIDLSRNVPLRLTSDPSQDQDGNWSADGRAVYFSSQRRGRPEIFRRSSSGIGSEDLVAEAGRMSDVSRDGKLLLQLRDGLTAVSVTGDKPINFLKSPLRDGAFIDEARFSPNGRWVAFNSNETDRHQVYIVSFPAADERWQVSVDGGVQPRWRRDGKELFYLAPDGSLMSVDVQEASSLRLGRPKPLFSTGARARSTSEEYDVSRDGSRIIVVRPASAVARAPINVVVNWLPAVRQQN